MKLCISAVAIAAILSMPIVPPVFAASAGMAMPMTAPVRLGDLEITGAFARATLPGAPVGGAYVTITNKGPTDDVLVSAQSKAAGRVSLHSMSMNGSVMRMADLPDGIAIPAGATIAMAPNGLHMMFEHLTGPFVKGAKVTVTLNFAKAGAVTLDIPVMGIAAKSAMSGMEM